MSPCVLDGSFLGVSHPVLDLGEGLFDRIEVWRIGWKEPESGTGRLDGLTDSRGFVAAEIVHDDDVAGSEAGNKLLFDIGAEASTVDRSVEDAWRGKFAAAQGTEKSQRAPMSMRSEAAQPFALRSPTAQGRHVGLYPGLVDEDQPFGIEVFLPRPPAPSSADDVGASLFKGEQSFF